MESGAAAAAAAIDKPKKPLHRKSNKPDHTKQHCSIFEVPPDFFDSCRLLHPSLSSLPDFENSLDDAVEESKSENEVTENNFHSSSIDSNDAKVMQRWSCNTCKAEFESLQEQRFHFKSDLHRFNIKLSIAGKSIIKEEDFDGVTSDSLSKDYDVSSISGSDDEDERETSVLNRQREFGGISKRQIFIQLKNGEIVTVWKCLLLNESENISFETDNSLVMDGSGVQLTQKEVVEKLKYILHEPRDNSRLRIVLLARGGHFAGCVFDGNSLVVHKTFHRYVVRAKAGKKQSSKDAGKQGIHSAGASLRRYNELALKKDIQELLTLWKPHFAVASCIFIYAPSNNRELFFDGEKPYFICQHRAIRNIPLTIRRPTLREARRIYSLLVQVSSELREEIARNTIQESLSGADMQTDIFPDSCKTELREDLEGKKIVEACSLVKEMDDLSVSTDSREDTDAVRMSTPLHEAAKSGNAEKVLDLLEQGLDPCIKDERGQTPYMVAPDKEVRNTFRRFMASNLEKWDWHTAKVPSALTKEMEEAQAAKQAEKDAKRKAKAKELKKLRKAKEKAQAEAAQTQNSSSKSGSLGGASVPTSKGLSKSSGSAIISKEEELKRMKDAEREKRAAAAERRMAAMKSGENNTNGSDIICSCCNVSLAGKVPFHRYNYKYCSTSCMHVHREILEDG